MSQVVRKNQDYGGIQQTHSIVLLISLTTLCSTRRAMICDHSVEYLAETIQVNYRKQRFCLTELVKQKYSMAFPQLPSYMTGSFQDNNGSTSGQVGLDSITLGQLKAMVGSVPKPKVCLTASKESSHTMHSS